MHAADTLDRHGIYSQALVSADVSALEAVYQNNGFSKVKIAPETNAVDTENASPQNATRSSHKPAGLTVTYNIDEGMQQRVGTVTFDGNDHLESSEPPSPAEHLTWQSLSPKTSQEIATSC